ncbi:hypothetical protein [Nocardia sp. NPDC050175]
MRRFGAVGGVFVEVEVAVAVAVAVEVGVYLVAVGPFEELRLSR